jgi:hypothetical protein
MGSLQERIAAYANASANLLTQLKELDELREQVKKAKKLSTATPKLVKQRPASFLPASFPHLAPISAKSVICFLPPQPSGVCRQPLPVALTIGGGSGLRNLGKSARRFPLSSQRRRVAQRSDIA